MRRSMLVLGLIALTTACTRIDETELCTLTTNGNVTEKVMSPGLELVIIDETTCFPKIQQVYPGGKTDGKPNSVVVEALTRDSVKLTIAVAVEHQIIPETYFDSVYTPKRNMDNFENSVGNSVREGATVAIGGVNSGDAFINREAFGTKLEEAIQRSLGSLSRVTRVYLTDMDLPPAVDSARQRVYAQGLAEQQALKQRRIDSLNNVTILQNEETKMKVANMKGQTYEDNPALADVEVKKARAEAMANICKGTTTCILGASVLESMGFTGVR